MNMSHVKNKWPIHVFFISQGITLFGVGYVILPVLLLLFWLVRTAIKTPAYLKTFYGQPLLLGLDLLPLVYRNGVHF